MGVILIFVDLAVMLVGAVYSIMITYRPVLAFGKGIGFLIGLIFLAPVFWLILGLGDAEYQPTEELA